MTDKERIKSILEQIDKEFPDRIKLGNRLNEVYKILAMGELELLTLDQYRGQNMDYVLAELQKEGLAVGDKLNELEKKIVKKYNVRPTDLISDLVLLNEFGVDNIKDLPKDASADLKKAFPETPPVEVKGNQVTNEDLQKAIDNLFDKVDGTAEKELVDHSAFAGGLVEELENMGYKSEVVESSLNKWLDVNADSDFLKNEFSWNAVPEANLPESPVLKGRKGLPITPEQDRMLEIKWADYWSTNGEGWGQQVHGTYTAEVVDGFYQFKADNPDIPNWWFPSDFMDGQQLTQRAFVGWGVTQEDIDNLKQGFEKGIFDKEKNKKLLKVVNDLDGSDKLIKPTVPKNAPPAEVFDFREKQLEKLMEELEEFANVEIITPEQAKLIDEALDDMIAQERRGNFKAIPGGKNSVKNIIKRRLANIFAGGLTLLDVYEIALIGSAIGQPAIDPIIKLIFPDTPDDDRSYGEKVMENLQRVENISPTAQVIKKIDEKLPDEKRKYNTFGVPENYSANFSPFYGILGG
jgi:hypothetical protein